MLASKGSRKSLALTKLIEIVGILIGAKLLKDRKKNTSSVLSNYEDTLNLLTQNFEGVVNYLQEMINDDISNEMSIQIYSKTLEEGFDYELGLFDGGDDLQILLSSVKDIIISINERTFPVRGNDLMIVITNDKSSYAVLDIASHILGKYDIND
jgi:hypothetical protein